MIGRKQEINLQFLQIIDGILLVVAFWGAHVIRYMAADLEWLSMNWPIPKFDDFRWMLFIIMPFGPILLELHGFYTRSLQKTVRQTLGQIGRASVWLALILSGCTLFFRLDIPSRAVLLLFLVLAPVFLLLRERVTIYRMRARARTGRYREPVLLAGTPQDTQALLCRLTPDQLLDMEVIAEVDIERNPVSHLVDLLHRHSVSRVIFAGNHSQMQRLQEAIGACEIEGVEAWLAADFIKTAIAKPSFDVLGSHPMLVFRTTPELSWSFMMKTLIDKAGAIFLIAASSPLFIGAALAIRLTSPGPVIFCQQRGGKHGKPFTMYKFRTMIPDAETRRASLEEQNEMSGPVFKIGRDPRVTPLGRWLRKTSIDELPQLINVLQGHMSLVGPRPLPLYEVEKFEKSAQRRRLSVKPGLTCLWQISGRSDLNSFDQWVDLDLDYIDNWSIWLDIKILLKTVPVVLFGLGAR